MRNKYRFIGWIFISLFSVTAFAQTRSPQSVEELCQSARDPENFQRLGEQVSARMAFKNNGGLAKGGVCWWHSRLQRAAIYLTVFRPEAPKPSLAQARQIIRTIKRKSGIAVIPGYTNFQEFSAAYARQIQDILEEWQRVDGILKFHWIRGLSGSSRIHPDKLRLRMDKLYELVTVQKKIVFQMLQLKGIVAHAWNVIGMVAVPNGYQLYVIDSNHPLSTEQYVYQYGDSSLTMGGRDFVPYTEESDELREINRRIGRLCGFDIYPKNNIYELDDSMELYQERVCASMGI
ncbi:MAG: hypothetical protein COT73_01710 [Bdellovibrio sp. CG10_big_fil_rev_8_21_14_0_10_47_8]|nr:MAG: hypothetical protein COT73_01710 [Bdellovibrio sp. CG10_big_fil_rev_8_21_14_0_10_47_8]